jgi:hypothetical protein
MCSGMVILYVITVAVILVGKVLWTCYKEEGDFYVIQLYSLDI